jgi:hypothetical protein
MSRVQIPDMRRAPLLWMLLLLLFSACQQESHSTGPNPGTPTAQAVQPPAPPAEPSPWQSSTSTNAVTGEITTTAVTGYGERNLVLRQIGKKLECFLETSEFLETVENMESNRSGVAYKFDDGPVVRQGWNMSSDHTALFYPGNPAAFLSKLRKAKHLAIEFHPADKVAQTVTLDVSQLPPLFAQIIEDADKAAAIATANLEKQRAEAVAHIKSYKGGGDRLYWYWLDSDGGQQVFETEDEAIKTYLEAHRNSH